jgi:uncharacterized membrane protein SpoIIM required for sporulation
MTPDDRPDFSASVILGIVIGAFIGGPFALLVYWTLYRGHLTLSGYLIAGICGIAAGLGFAFARHFMGSKK